MNIGKIRVSAADQWFSKCVRQRAGWKCERCGKDYSENRRGLSCSHVIGRAWLPTRFCPTNVTALCFGCHAIVTANPLEHIRVWAAARRRGLSTLDKLDEQALDEDVHKQVRSKEKHISKYYRETYREMVATGEKEFKEVDYDFCHKKQGGAV